MDAYVVDAFTDRAFGGNPAGVVVLDAPADPAWMQSVAAEFKHAETAFVVVGGSEDGFGNGPAEQAKPLRWFTPTTEVDLCGHATLATAHVLGGSQRFDTRSGELSCTVTHDGMVEMDFPRIPSQPTRAPDEVTAGLPGVTVEHIARGEFDLLVQAASATEVRALQADLDLLARIPARAVIVTAPGDRADIDFVSRVFAPGVGIPEDPVTGSAHCALAPWWSAALGRTAEGAELVGEQASARGGLVRMTLRGSRVGLAGQAVTVLRGDLSAG
ncbi:PhzF family phenazine biosynthesis protein [Haloactinomyces albus]|uniref:PhzF superfamily epimerase YddE/YHI9 n=1 Tax=Haloactinomyces albus TaxID=1352928 RepID=A0AAE3ZCT5_9ACTN|nr:PhzF family phenazine biosynthesis protein [Haloactinomyces albus]MDR7301515.1 putative PhzF superfamily epimerase YddE/YHI9 [Haloactinomyces albus]